MNQINKDYIIDYYELLKYDIKYFSPEQTVLRILKSKGAPIDGNVVLKFNKNYEIVSWTDQIKLETHFKFYPLKHKSL